MGERRQAPAGGARLASSGLCRASAGHCRADDDYGPRLRVELKLGKREGLPRDCVVNCDWLVTLPKADLVERAGALSPAKLGELDEALRFALGLEG